MNNKKITQKEIDYLNELVKANKIEITECHSIWGARAFKTKNDYLKVTCEQGRFYGGGISDNYYTLWIDSIKQFTTDNLLIAEKSFLDCYKKYVKEHQLTKL